VFAAYLILAWAAAWPLSADLGGLLPGEPSNDTGVYVWNLWAFRHELVAHGRLPLWTDHILQPGSPIDLALHNYTIFQDVLGLVLIPWLGLVRSFNAIWIAMQALSGLAVFLLARRVTSRDGLACLAGILFAFSPTMIARSTAHQSLVAAGPLAFFLLFALRAADTRRLRDAALAGACAAWAGYSDAYYGVYCIPLLAVVTCARALRFDRFDTPRRAGRFVAALTWLMLAPAAIAAIVIATGGGHVEVLGVRIRATTIYTPMLVLTSLLLVRGVAAMRRRGRWRIDVPPGRDRIGQFAVGAFVCALLLLPLLNAARVRVQSGGEIQERVLWRSSPPGVDLAWLFVPNPNHPLAPASFRDFVTTRPDSYPENVASLPYVALIVIGLAVVRARPPRVWIWILVSFGLLALGPFLAAAHVNTHIPGPWALLRYVPILGATRTPTRFLVPALMAFAVLFAWSLDRVARRRAVAGAVAAALAFELLPVPRVAAGARVPALYSTIAADPDDVSVLEIPFGIWDGTSQHGFPNIAATYYQTTHQKRTVGGYLSRVPPSRVRDHLRFPTLRLLTVMSEGKPVEPNLAEAAREDARYFIEQARVRYVVIDPRLASAELRKSAIEVLQLRLVESEDGLELYQTAR
jgi:hypothetical protein